MRRQLRAGDICYLRERIKMILPFEIGDLTEENKRNGVVSSEPGERVISGEKGVHYGMDFRMPIGSRVLAAYDGKIIKTISNYPNYGNYIMIQHERDIYTLYAHLDKITSLVGTEVKRGDIIGFSGNTGRSTGPHLHFEVIDGVLEVTQMVENPPKSKIYEPRTRLAKTWIEWSKGSSNTGLHGDRARINPRDFLCDIEEEKLVLLESISGDRYQAEFMGSDCMANRFFSNWLDNRFHADCSSGENVLLGSSTIVDYDRRRLEHRSNTTNSYNKTYNFVDVGTIGRDRIYDNDPNARINLGGNLINNATLTA